MNGQKFKGRTVALEFSLPQGKYEKKVQHIVENTNQERQDVIVPKQLKEEREERRKKEDERKVKIEEVKKAK